MRRQQQHETSPHPSSGRRPAPISPSLRPASAAARLPVGRRTPPSRLACIGAAIVLLAGAGAATATAATAEPASPPPAAPVNEQQLASNPSLDLVVRYAVEHNPAIRSRDNAVQAAEEHVIRERAYRNPMLTIGPDTGNMAETRAGPQGNSIGFSQEVPFPGKLSLRGDIAQDQASALHEQVQATIDEVSRQARARYADYYLGARALEVNHETTELARQLAAISEARYRVGSAAQQDVIQAQEKLSLLAAERVTFEGQENTALGALNAVLDRPPRAAVGRPAEPPVGRLAISLAELVDQANAVRPELRAQDHVIHAGEHSVSLAKMGFLPDLSVGGQYIQVFGGTNPSFAQDGHDIWMATLGVSVPLWIDRIQAEIHESQARLLEEEYGRRDLANRVSDQVQQAYEALGVAAQTEEIYRTTLIPQTQERIAAARAGYQTGLVDFLTLINSLDALEKTELDRFRSVRAYQQALADLERAVGKPVPTVAGGGGR
jgi:cobalt-zinc-cadmium efflux system outer membrane protein